MLHRVYVDAGVLVDDSDVREHPVWGFVTTPEEAALTGRLEKTPLSALSRKERQLLAVERSRVVGFQDLYLRLERELETIPPKDIRRNLLEGIMYRLHPLVQGAAARQYAAGNPPDKALRRVGADAAVGPHHDSHPQGAGLAGGGDAGWPTGRARGAVLLPAHPHLHPRAHDVSRSRHPGGLRMPMIAASQSVAQLRKLTRRKKL